MVYCGRCKQGVMVLDNDLNGEHCLLCGYHNKFELCEENANLDLVADIWVSSGKDDDYTFGFDSDELDTVE